MSGVNFESLQFCHAYFCTSRTLTTLTYIWGVPWDLINVCKSLWDTETKGATKHQHPVGNIFKNRSSSAVTCQLLAEGTETAQFVSTCSSNWTGFVRGQSPFLREGYLQSKPPAHQHGPAVTLRFRRALLLTSAFLQLWKRSLFIVFLTSVWLL